MLLFPSEFKLLLFQQKQEYSMLLFYWLQSEDVNILYHFNAWIKHNYAKTTDSQQPPTEYTYNIEIWCYVQNMHNYFIKASLKQLKINPF